MRDEKRYWDIAFILLLIAVPVLSLPFHYGISIFDPASYIKSANFLLKGRWTLDNFYANRIASCVPYAIGIMFFGISEYLTLITTVELMALLVLIYLVIGKYNKTVAFISVAMLGTSELMLQCASAIGSDIMITLTANAVVLVWFYFRKQNPDAGKAVVWGILSGIIFCIAFLSKESIAFYVPLLLYFAFKDYRQPVLRKFWVWMGLTVFFFASAILAFYAIKTGDALFRFHIVEAGPSASEVNYHHAAFGEILKRCTYEPFQFIIRNLTFSILFILSIIHLLTPSRSEEQSIVKKYFLFTIIFWWFGSQSFTSWNPVGLVHRIWLPLLVPMAINAAYAIHFLMLEPFETDFPKKVRYSIGLVVMILAGWAAFYTSFTKYESINRSYYELAELLSNILWINLIAVITFAFIWIKNTTPKTLLYKSLILLVILFPAIYKIHLSGVWFLVDKESRPVNDFRAEKEIVSGMEDLHPKIILAEITLCDNYGLYVGFDKILPFVDYDKIHPDSIPLESYLLVNEKRMQFWKDNLTEAMGFKMQKREIPDFATFPPEKYGFVVVKQVASCKLYQKKT